MKYLLTWVVTFVFAGVVIALAENGILNWGEEFVPGTRRMVGYRIEADAYIWLIVGIGAIWLAREAVDW